MKTNKSSFGIIFHSSLVWIGLAVTLGALFTYVLIWSGHLNVLARLADAIHAGLYIGPILSFILLVGIGLTISGLVLGLVRLVQKQTIASIAPVLIARNAEPGKVTPMNPVTRLEGGRIARLIVLVTFTFLLLIAAVLNLPSNYSLTHACQIRITDENHRPVAGLRVVHTWGVSTLRYGSQESRTDANGTVDFAPVSVEMSLLNRLEMRWAPSLVHDWYPGRDSLPITVYLQENVAASFDSGIWRPVIQGDPSAYTNQSGVFVRYWGAYAEAIHQRYPAAQMRFNIPQQNSIGLGLPNGNQAIALQVCENVQP